MLTFAMIVRLLAGAVASAMCARSLSRLADLGAQEVFGPFDGDLLRWTVYAVGLAVGIMLTLEWSGFTASVKKA